MGQFQFDSQISHSDSLNHDDSKAGLNTLDLLGVAAIGVGAAVAVVASEGRLASALESFVPNVLKPNDLYQWTLKTEGALVPMQGRDAKQLFERAENLIDKFPGARIHPGAYIDSGVNVGDKTIVSDGAKLRFGSEVHSDSFIGQNALIGHNTQILPGARIGDYAKIGENVDRLGENGVRIMPFSNIANGTVIKGERGFGFEGNRAARENRESYERALKQIAYM